MNDILYTAVSRYFNVISSLGYYPYKDIYKVLYLFAIKEMLEGSLEECNTTESIKKLQDSFMSMVGTSCLLPYLSNCDNKEFNFFTYKEEDSHEPFLNK